MRTFCVPCHEHNIKDWAAHARSEKHQRWVESVHRANDPKSYQGEPDRKERDEDGNEN